MLAQKFYPFESGENRLALDPTQPSTKVVAKPAWPAARPRGLCDGHLRHSVETLASVFVGKRLQKRAEELGLLALN